jgi:UDP-3-O-[3-hydroxymyristoyl] glucosamine N-acyltransferase
MEITIIGKGGFAREVKAYLFSKDKESTFNLIESQDYTNGLYVIAIADPYIREIIANEIGDENSINISLGKNYSGKIESKGTIVCPDVIITDNVTIGKHCQFNIQTSIGHDCKIGNFVTTAPKVSISGNVTIGDRVYIGTGVIIKEKTYICNDVIIGAGAVVLNDITEPGTYVGIPAKKIK